MDLTFITRTRTFNVVLLILFAMAEAHAQWSPATLSVGRCQLAATTAGTKAFFAGGSEADSAKLSSDVDIYDNSTNTWSTSHLSEARAELAAASLGNKVFFAGGNNGTTHSRVIDIYNATNNTWSITKLSEARSQLCAVSAGNKVFFAGGRTSGGRERSDVVDIYDKSTNTWTISKLSLARTWLAAAAVGSKVLFAGGLDARSASSDVVDIYDIVTNTWSRHKLSQARYDLAATSVGSKVLFAGGNTPLGESDVVDIYDYTNNSWSSYQLSKPRYDLSATSVGGKAIIAGGNYLFRTSNVVDIYDDNTSTWSVSTLATSRNSMGATAVGTKAIFAGGWGTDTQNPVRAVNIYESDTDAPEISIEYKNVGTLNANGKLNAILMVTDASLIASVKIGQDTKSTRQSNDTLRYELELQPGAELRVIAKDKFGITADRVFLVPQPSAAGAVLGTTAAATQHKYYALLMAVEKYTDPGIIPLNEPAKEATLLKEILIKKYGFDKNNITFLKDPTSDDMSLAFDSLTQKVTDKDFLLIFYAGHGGFDEKTKIGYWLLSDASKTNKARWYRNSALKEDIGAINSKHTMLISDACFSGGIFKTRSLENNASTSVNNMMKLPSRKAMTSGALTTVPDKSVFMKYLLKYLQENNKQFLPSADLYYSIRMAMENNANTVPQYGDIQDVGDEGGDFVFYQPDKP